MALSREELETMQSTLQKAFASASENIELESGRVFRDTSGDLTAIAMTVQAMLAVDERLQQMDRSDAGKNLARGGRRPD